MTPMVDLAFLLLTFFILTTSLRRLEGIELIAPLGHGGKNADLSLTFLVGGRDTIYGYAGEFDPATTVPKRYGPDQVRASLASVKDTAGLALFIKPRKNARYADLLALVDACNAARLRHYSVQDSVPGEEWTAAVPLIPFRITDPSEDAPLFFRRTIRRVRCVAGATGRTIWRSHAEKEQVDRMDS